MMPVIEAHDLCKSYNGTLALDGLTLAIPEGSIGLLGENGAGKTTLIKLLLGLLRPTAGSVRVFGLNVANEGPAIRQRLGYMPEDECLPADLSAFDLVVRMGQLSGLPHEAAVQRTHDVLHLVGLGEERYRPIGGYSVGMKQRVKLAQALVHDPKLVLLDEPTSGMDPQGREEMLELIRDIRQRMGISLLLSSHLLFDVERVCEHVVILGAGRVRAQGPLEQLVGTVSEGLVLRVVGNSDAFVEGLLREGVKVERMGAELRVQGALEEACDIIWKEAARTGVQLRRLEREVRSLEEVFLGLHRTA
jgi:ABC-2 type transport system ATP-binding protein